MMMPVLKKLSKLHVSKSRTLQTSRGSALIAVMVISIIASIMVLGLLSYVKDTARINDHVIWVERAEMTAEAGLQLLISYFDHWERDDPTTEIVEPDESGFWPANLRDTIQVTVHNFFDTDDGVLDPDYWLDKCPMQFIDDGLNETLIPINESMVIRLWVELPRAEAPAGTMLTFYSRCEATTRYGHVISRLAIMDVTFDSGPRIVSPAAIVSGGAVASNGQFNLHWGEAWALGNMRVCFNTKNSVFNGTEWSWQISGNDINMVNRGDSWDDAYISLMSAQGYILDNNGTRIINDSTWYDVGEACTDSNYHSADPGNEPSVLYQFVDDMRTAAGETTLTEEINFVLNQFMELDNTENGYEFWKEIAITRDTYFRVEADGDVVNADGDQYYYTINDGEYHLNTDGDGHALSEDTAMDYYRGMDDTVLIFFDTEDGNPPADDGSNWAYLTLNGNIDTQSSGLLYVAGSMTVGGTHAPDFVMTAPDGETTESDVSVLHNGLIFCWGDYRNSGSPVVYGSIVCGGNYNTDGDPNLWYNYKLADGFEPQPVSSVARVLTTIIQ